MHHLNCRHGRRLQFSPERTALVSIDMQRDFLEPDGYAAHCGENPSLLSRARITARQSLSAARAAGLQVIHTREGHAADLVDLHPAKQGRSCASGVAIGDSGPLGRFLIRGEYGHDFIDELKPHSGEWVIDKSGYGAFYDTSLKKQLRKASINTLFLLGVTTQCCVFSTLREAVDRGFYCVLVEDACAAFEPRQHDATLRMIASEGHLFGWITDTKTLAMTLNCYTRNPRPA